MIKNHHPGEMAELKVRSGQNVREQELGRVEQDLGEYSEKGRVSFENIGKSYKTVRGQIPIISGITADLEAGTFTSILGPSGCGKSTLLNLVAGLDHPTEGVLRVHGRPSRGIPDSVGFVFQEPALYPWRTALENVVMPLEGRIPKAELRDRGLQQLDRVGLLACRDRRPHELSGGMKQRVMLARVFLTRPAVLLLDEPFGALDALTREAMQASLLDLWICDRPTVIFVTHAVDEAVYLSQRVIVLSHNPARVATDTVIDEDYPRNQTFRFCQRFSDWCKNLHSYLAPSFERENVG
jgi:NitT/TauT family transport system ATP-binding protein